VCLKPYPMTSVKKFSRHVVLAVEAVKTHIDQHPSNGESAALLASRVQISRNVLQEVFKWRYGVDIGQYKLQLRMRHAQELLQNGHAIKEVAIILKYSSASAFCSAFKNYTGQTPARWHNGNNSPNGHK
jgi:two-component system, response regulator YesN